jgi:hypothetical protein
MKKVLLHSDLKLKKSQEPMMGASTDVLDVLEVEMDAKEEEEIRKSNLRDYLETYGFMDDAI